MDIVKHIERDNVRLVLLDFARLASAERREFLGAMNDFLFSSPQRRRAIMATWEISTPHAPCKSKSRTGASTTATAQI
ncbi:hypothetical protein [Burkholderia ubonensis]|uniref:hypothetical protein n=1 Tax=Burkholderia ubonensis TaxID=101571 RepID=UPI0012FB5C15|nr:hypothetical protein [Burkholderia ubonensis]